MRDRAPWGQGRGQGLPKYMWLKLTLAARFSLDLFEPRCSEWVHPRIHPKLPFYDLFAVRKALTKNVLLEHVSSR